jgi:hypothetical protein
MGLLVGILIGVVGSLVAAGIVAITRRGRAKVAARDPLHVVVERPLWPPWFVSLPGEFTDREDVEREANEQLAPGRRQEVVYDLLRARGAIDFWETQAELHLRGNAPQAVVITNIRAHVVRRDSPLTGKVLGAVAQGVNDDTTLMFDLDSQTEWVDAWEWKEDFNMGERKQTGTRPFFTDHTISLVHDETLTVIVIGKSEREYCQWRVVIEMLVGAKRHTITVGERGLPFGTTGGDEGRFREASHWYWNEQGEFLDIDPGGGYVQENARMQDFMKNLPPS